MNYEQTLALLLSLLNTVMGAIGQIAQQKGMTTEEILARAEGLNKETRDAVDAYLANLPKS